MNRSSLRCAVVLFAFVTASMSCVCTEEQSGGAGAKHEPDVVYIPTPHDVVDMMLQLARVRKDDVVYDLGCGDGRIVVAAARKYGCRAVGYDIDPERVKESRRNVRKNKVGHLVTIEEKDIFTLDLRGASVVTLYLLPRLNVRLIPQLEKLKPGTRIVSHDFDMKGVKPDAVLTMWSNGDGGDEEEHRIYLWTTPLKKEPVQEEELEEVVGPPDEWEGGPVQETTPGYRPEGVEPAP